MVQSASAGGGCARDGHMDGEYSQGGAKALAC